MEAHVANSWSSGKYGACAIGKEVTFYKWTRETGTLTSISRTLDLDVSMDRPVIEEWLDHII